jgi:UDP-glucuronate 4-epimerase
MAYFSFTKAIIEEKPIQLFNQGNLYRDFTFIDDIVTGIIKVFGSPPIPDVNDVRYKIYNIGNQKPEKLIYFVETLEQCIGKKAIKEYLPMQPGDMIETYADISDLMEDFGFSPKVPISIGLGRFVEWYRNKYVI